MSPRLVCIEHKQCFNSIGAQGAALTAELQHDLSVILFGTLSVHSSSHGMLSVDASVH